MNVSASQKHKNNIILLTFIIYVDNSVGEKVTLRVLADSRPQVALLRSSTADFLNLRKLKTDMSVSGLGGCASSRPHFLNIGNSIDALLSADIFFDILKDGKYKLDNGNLILQNTEFGYIISGNTSGFSSGSLHCGFITREFESLNDTLKSFWEVEEIVPTKFVSDELKKCDKHFLKTMIRDTKGCFCVEMPMKDSDIELGQSKSTTIRRLKMLERRFVRKPDTKDKYVEFPQEYEDLGHMQRVKDEEPGDYIITFLTML
ncbi:integrase catalytic domain-containing protein [Trichonephila inaurata madagascariensis]|uniref:Integrase catalytic domain-containing protein n=1 Tax=Trichonephila inaurata madagascariensis TaxID=2747483 RepID=A0A8X6WW20_9ARAC|nr:integrase catalytic domain-containing protein [Trichonephila inaurata madagascariensis]